MFERKNIVYMIFNTKILHSYDFWFQEKLTMTKLTNDNK